MVNSYWFNNLTTFISAAQNPYYPKPYPPFQGFKFFPFGGAPYGARCVRWNVPGGVNYTGKKWVGDLCYDLDSSYRTVDFQWSTTGK